jgi:hypothetical protein
VRIARQLSSRPKVLGGFDDSLEPGPKRRLFEGASDRHSDEVVDAFVSHKGEGSKQPIVALRKAHGEGLQWLFLWLLHHCTMIETGPPDAD